MNGWNFELWHVLVLYVAAFIIGAVTMFIHLLTTFSGSVEEFQGELLVILAMLIVSAILFYRARRKNATDAS